MNEGLRTPINYYGGKVNMLKHILPLIPEHLTYVEPFFGGGAVYWAKPPANGNVVNDVNDRLICFYQVLRDDFESLQALIDETFHSRALHREAAQIYDAHDLSTDEARLQMAWAVWVQTNMSFGRMIRKGFAYDRQAKDSFAVYNKKNRFTELYKARLQRTIIESNDALTVIRAYDHRDTFYYIDPPYFNSDCGHYAGYGPTDFQKLLDSCSQMQGRFLLSSYQSPLLTHYAERFRWQQRLIVKTLNVDSKRPERKEKIEVLTWNY